MNMKLGNVYIVFLLKLPFVCKLLNGGAKMEALQNLCLIWYVIGILVYYVLCSAYSIILFKIYHSILTHLNKPQNSDNFHQISEVWTFSPNSGLFLTNIAQFSNSANKSFKNCLKIIKNVSFWHNSIWGTHL